MELGWIDFSKDERNKVLSVIHLLDEPAAVDELGLGIIRDAFADLFFPGTSTVQTRAKYFLIVPFILKEAGEGLYGKDVNTILRKIDNMERKCRDILIKTSSDGVIGSLVPSSWVQRTPSNIYWNGIKRLGIFTADLSVKEYIRHSLLQKKLKEAKAYGNRKKDAEENEKDDIDAGDIESFQMWDLGNTYHADWMDDLSIELLPEEADFLRTQIITKQHDTLFAFILKNDISLDEYESFGALSADVKDSVGEELAGMMRLADGFNRLVALIMSRYNLIVSKGENKEADDYWRLYSGDLNVRSDVDLRQIYERLNIKNVNLRAFLLRIKELFLSGDIKKADELIVDREVRIKDKSRAKTLRAGEYPVDEWIGTYMFDYRYTPAKRIIKDIMNVKGM